MTSLAKGKSPTQRTLEYYRTLGYHIGVVEKWNPHAKIRQDLFGFVDLIAFNDEEVLAIQATSTGNMSSRRDKIFLNEAAYDWVWHDVPPHRRLILIGWKKYAKPEDGKYWRPTIEVLDRWAFPQPEG